MSCIIRKRLLQQVKNTIVINVSLLMPLWFSSLLDSKPEFDLHHILTCSDGKISRNVTGHHLPHGHQALHLLLHFAHPQLVAPIPYSCRNRSKQVLCWLPASMIPKWSNFWKKNFCSVPHLWLKHLRSSWQQWTDHQWDPPDVWCWFLSCCNSFHLLLFRCALSPPGGQTYIQRTSVWTFPVSLGWKHTRTVFFIAMTQSGVSVPWIYYRNNDKSRLLMIQCHFCDIKGEMCAYMYMYNLIHVFWNPSSSLNDLKKTQTQDNRNISTKYGFRSHPLSEFCVLWSFLSTRRTSETEEKTWLRTPLNNNFIIRTAGSADLGLLVSPWWHRKFCAASGPLPSKVTTGMAAFSTPEPESGHICKWPACWRLRSSGSKAERIWTHLSSRPRPPWHRSSPQLSCPSTALRLFPETATWLLWRWLQEDRLSHQGGYAVTYTEGLTPSFTK